jgi:hypothetical protein
LPLHSDNQRSAVIYAFLRKRLTTSVNMTANNTTGDSAVVSAAVKLYPHESSEWTDSTGTVELKQRGPRWYVDELKSPEWPGGGYQRFKQKMESPPRGASEAGLWEASETTPSLDKSGNRI